MENNNHVERVKKELRDAGIVSISMARLSSGYVPKVIHSDEHILAAVYGHRREAKGIFGYEVGLLIATDQRVLYIVHRPGFTTLDEMQYDLVSGVSLVNAGLFASITLHTSIANYVLSFVRPKSANHFVTTIEKTLIASKLEPSEIRQSETKQNEKNLSSSDGVMDFMLSHNVGVLSSIERSGAVSGAAVYYVVIDSVPYFMTKSESNKVANIAYYHNIALTIYDPETLQTVQIQGIAETEENEDIKERVEDSLRLIQSQSIGTKKPPVTKLAGKTLIYRIATNKMSFIDYSPT